jgi:ankyrin repeat protein
VQTLKSAKELNKALWKAADDGDVKVAAELLALGADVNALGRDSGALHIAAFNGDAAMCLLLIEAGADVSLRDKHSLDTPLHEATRSRDGFVSLEVIEHLLKAGADPNAARVPDSATPLHMLRWDSDLNAIDAIEMMVQYGALPGMARSVCPVSRSSLGTEWVYLTPFQEAVRAGSSGVVEFYLDSCGERLDQLTADGRTLSEVAGDFPHAIAALLSVQAERAVRTAMSDADAVASPDPAIHPAKSAGMSML